MLAACKHELACGFQARGEIGQTKADGLMLDDGLAHRFAFLRIGRGDFERRLRHADRLRGDADASRFEIRQRDAIALAFGAEAQVAFDA